MYTGKTVQLVKYLPRVYEGLSSDPENACKKQCTHMVSVMARREEATRRKLAGELV